MENELRKAPSNVRDYFALLPSKSLEKVNINLEIVGLANNYISEKVVGKTSFDDCLYTAAATA
jgi:hypothetical protein